MKSDFFQNFSFGKFIISNLSGLVSAFGLAVAVSLICRYNFFLMLILFTVVYFVLGVMIEYLLVALYIEKAKKVSKKKKKKTVNTTAKNIQNKKDSSSLTGRYAAQLRNKKVKLMPAGKDTLVAVAQEHCINSESAENGEKETNGETA